MAIFHKPKKAQKRKPIQEVVIDEDQIEDIDEVEIEAPVKSSIAQSILFPTVHHRCFGFKLLRSKDINYTIHAFRRPCEVQEVNFNEPIQKLWSNDKLSSQNKKDIVNRTTGLCEKKYNSASVCKIFDSYAEAQFYQVQNLGKIHSLRQSFKTTVTTQQNYDSDFQYDKVITQTTYGKEIHLLVNEKNEMLVEGYRYIKELIYDIMSLKMYDLYNEVVSKGIKTDAILVSKSKSEIEHLFNFTSDIGGIKFESGKKCPNRKVVQIVN